MKRNRLHRIILLLWTVICLSLSGIYALAVPAPDAAVTEKNILSLMDAYDTDAAYILRNSGDSSSMTRWWSGSSLIDGIDTGVHEEFHTYTWNNASSWNAEAIYVGSGKTIDVPYTEVYASQIMASGIPESLRTTRYSTYVSSSSGNMSSNVEGIYGLLNEYSAYYWGMHAQMSLYDYYIGLTATNPKVWYAYIRSGENNMTAYAEFQYYIYRYLLYAQKHYPDVYTQILDNSSFMSAYRTITKKFIKQIKAYQNSIPKIVDALTKAGYASSYSNGMLRIGLQGSGVSEAEYAALMVELKKTSYASLESVLGTAAYIAPTETYSGTAAQSALLTLLSSDSSTQTTKSSTSMTGTITSTASNGIYDFFTKNGTTQLRYVKPINASSTRVVIPAAITVNGVSYPVTAIASGAFKNNQNLKAVVIGKNITKIGSSAFNGCSKLKKITIKSKKLTGSSIGKKAFSKIYKKAAIKVPGGKAAAYKKLLRASGAPKKIRVK